MDRADFQIYVSNCFCHVYMSMFMCLCLYVYVSCLCFIFTFHVYVSYLCGYPRIYVYVYVSMFMCPCFILMFQVCVSSCFCHVYVSMFMCLCFMLMCRVYHNPRTHQCLLPRSRTFFPSQPDKNKNRTNNHHTNE